MKRASKLSFNSMLKRPSRLFRAAAMFSDVTAFSFRVLKKGASAPTALTCGSLSLKPCRVRATSKPQWNGHSNQVVAEALGGLKAEPQMQLHRNRKPFPPGSGFEFEILMAMDLWGKSKTKITGTER